MAISKTEGQRFVGIVVGGGADDPDPKKLGRVRVLVPQHAGPQVNPKDIPFSSLGSVANDTGAISFDRPLQDGTVVSIYYPPGSKSSAQGLVELVYNGQHDPQDLPNNFDMTNLFDWWIEARKKIPEGLKAVETAAQEAKTNFTGAEKITAKEIVNKAVSTMQQRIGIPSNLSFPSIIKSYADLKNVATALQHTAAAMTSELASQLPGLSFNFNQLLSVLPKDLTNKVLGSMPADVAKGFVNMLGVMSSFDPKSGTNFLHEALRVNSDSFFSKAAEALTGIKSFAELETAIKKIITDPTISNIASLASKSITLAGPFGEITQVLSAAGTLELSISDLVTKAQEALSNLLSSVNTAVKMLDNSKIIEEMLHLLPLDVQADFKTMLESFPSTLPKVFAFAGAFFGGSGSGSGGSSVIDIPDAVDPPVIDSTSDLLDINGMDF